MAQYVKDLENKSEKREGLLWSMILHLILLLLCFLPFVSEIPTQESFAGILVDFGNETIEATPIAAATPTEVKEQKETVEENKEAPSKKQPNIQSKSLQAEATVQASQEVAEPVKENKEEKQENTPSKSAEEITREKEAAEKKALEEATSKFANMFGKDEQKADQGDPSGAPSTDKLQASVGGKAKVGEGLTGRGIVFRPTIQDNSNKEGKVVIALCVDAAGNVIKKNFTQKGSTTADQHLIQLALQGAAKYKFSPSDAEEQCGTITVQFILRS